MKEGAHRQACRRRKVETPAEYRMSGACTKAPHPSREVSIQSWGGSPSVEQRSEWRLSALVRAKIRKVRPQMQSEYKEKSYDILQVRSAKSHADTQEKGQYFSPVCGMPYSEFPSDRREHINKSHRTLVGHRHAERSRRHANEILFY